jgi:hypothetical protein
MVLYVKEGNKQGCHIQNEADNEQDVPDLTPHRGDKKYNQQNQIECCQNKTHFLFT